MKKGDEVFVGIDTAKTHKTVAVAEAGRDGEVRYLGVFENTPDAVAKRRPTGISPPVNLMNHWSR
jgi:transposase